MTLKRFLLFFVLLTACTTAPKKPTGNDFKTARWGTKLRVKDLVKNKSNNLTVNVLGERGGSMRLEASAMMGVPIASYVMSGDSFRCALYRHKVFYEGPLTEEAMKPLIGFPISPKLLSRLAFDETVSGGDWKCQTDDKGWIENCESAARKLQVSWKREDDGKIVHIVGQSFELDWVFENPQTEVQFKEGSFQLPPPPGFRVIRLNK